MLEKIVRAFGVDLVSIAISLVRKTVTQSILYSYKTLTFLTYFTSRV